jgi:site-specific DNA-methyltransferase (adenine-specific)
MMHQNADLIVVARKPLSERTVADNVLRYGTGGINIDESRIELNGDYKSKANGRPSLTGLGDNYNKESANISDTVGRFPSNLIIDEEFGKILDEQSGISKSSGGKGEKSKGSLGDTIYGKYKNETHAANAGGLGDTGGASRFFKIITDDESESNENINMENVKLLKGNNIDLLRELEDNSVDSIVTDPPYGLSFMGKKWDYDVPTVELWEECMRVLKPGGHLLAFSGTRTYHRMVVRIEDAGFEIRDMISWLYGSGFPKSMDISKQIDKKLGAQREVISMRTDGNKGGGTKVFDDDDYIWDKPFPVTEATSDEAKQWSGWGTALKPAVEPVVMARKPLSEPTVADNVLKYGTGGINIDESRIPTGDELGRDFTNGKSDIFGGGSGIPGSVTSGNSNGRFPANLIIDEEAGKLLDEQSGLDRGQKGVVSGNEPSHTKKNAIYGDYSMVSGKYAEPKDSGGGASRFFYCPKTSKSDRNEGLDLFEDRPSYMVENGSKTSGVSGERYERATIQKNNHPTVKPTDLMLYLIRLVTPKGGTTLDPFMGSGSTGKAAVRGGFGFIGMELEEEYFDIAEARIKWESDKPKTITTSKTKKDDVLTNPETIETLNKFFGE